MGSSGTTATDPAFASVQLLTIGHVAELLRVHRRTVWRLVASGTLPAPLRLAAKTVRWRLADLERALQEAAK